MNFFKSLSELALTGDVKLVIKPLGEQYVVSILVDNANCTDKAKTALAPLVLTGTPDELDEGFFTEIGKPLKKQSGLMVDWDAYNKQTEAATKLAKIETDKADKLKKEGDAKKTAYTNAMKAVDELKSAGKIREALKKLPDAKLYPDMAGVIKQKRDNLMGSLTGGGLFDMSTPADDTSTDTSDAVDTDESGEDNDEDDITNEENDD